MIDCLILGDSIATGISQFRPDCVVQAKVGISSEDYANALFTQFSISAAKKTIISLGSNDAGIDSYGPMLAIRELIKGDVVWVLSSNNVESRFAALTIAKKYGDDVIDTASYSMSVDGVHPTTKGYTLIARSF